MSAAGLTVTEHAPETYPIAELERRFYAFFIDRLIGWTLVAVAGFGAWLVLDDVWTAVAIGSGVLALSWLVIAVLVGVSGNTPGKAMVGLRVVHHGTGTPIGVGRSLLRSVVLALASVPTFALGLATLAWTAVEDRGRQRRGWHDHVAHSVVVDVRPMAAFVDEVDEGARHVVNLTAMRLIPAPPIEPPAPPRRVNPEQSTRRTPMPQQATPVPVQQQPQAPQHARQQPPAAPRAQLPPTPPPPPSVPPTHPPDDDGRTAVRVRPGAVPTGPRWRVTFDNGESFLVEGLALVGRRPEPRSGEQVHHLVPLSSADMSVSKTHAQFGPASDGVLVVMDRGSTNGSVLIRQGVSRPLTAGKPATLVDGDVVSFGDRQMSVRREA
ncbi:MAG: RDD family protein [Nocardioides sp.]|uniref:RDD family protein n=1 Tax=Nocardioides sp. TaxID=35761 RepID=UPI003263B9FE